MDLLSIIEEKKAKMSKSHKLIADYILENYDKASYMTALKLGKTIGVSESTVVRFAYSLGYDGFPVFQNALKQFVQSKLTSLQRIEISQEETEHRDIVDSVLKADMANIKNTLEEMDKDVFNQIINTILTSSKVYIVGVRSCASLTSYLIHYLNYLIPDNLCIMPNYTDELEYLIRITPNDCLIGISFPRYSKRTVEAMEFANKQGAKTIAITDNQMSPLANHATYPLFAKSDTTTLADSLVAPLSIINAIIAAVSIKKQNEAKEYFNKLEEVWGNRNIYSEKEQNLNE